MKNIKFLLLLLMPAMMFGQIGVNKTDTTLQTLIGGNLLKWRAENWTLRVRDTALAYYIPLSQKAAANGVATLDAGGKVPAAQIPVQPNLVGEWDASTNTPTLANGSGTANAMYAVSVAGTRDLGSGSLVFSVGDWVAYASDNKWHLIPHGTAVIGANPSATIGLTAVNGTSPNFMRADAAPAINQAITPTWTGAHKFSNNVTVGGQLGSANNTDLPSPTNSGITIGGAPTWAMASFYDQALTTNNRTADMLFITNQIKFRFANDARNAFLDVFSITGGQAMGVTGITSTSGSGAWAHTGAFSTTGAQTVLPAGGNGVVVTGTNSSGTPSIAATGAANNITLIISAKGGAPVQITSPLQVANSLTVGGASVTGVVASDGKNAQAVNINEPTFYAVPASGMYRVSAFVVLSQAATTSSSLPSCSVSYTEATTGVAVQDIITQTAATNLVGLHAGGSVIINALQGANIGYVTSGYASSGATPMQYSIHIKIEFLG